MSLIFTLSCEDTKASMKCSIKKSKFIIIVAFVIVFHTPVTCFANAGIPMIYLELPFMVTLLIPVIIFEACLLSKFLLVNTKESLILSGKANLISTLIGFPLSWLLSLLVELAFSVFPYLIYKFNLEVVFESVYRNHELLFDILGLFVMAPWLAPIENKLYWMIPAAGFIGLIPAYFVTVLFEYKFLKSRIKCEAITIKSAIIKVNAYSYMFLALVWAGQMLYNVLTFKQGKDMILIPFSLF